MQYISFYDEKDFKIVQQLVTKTKNFDKNWYSNQKNRKNRNTNKYLKLWFTPSSGILQYMFYDISQIN